MTNKKVLSSLEFQRKARLVAPVIDTEARSSITVAPDGSLIYDETLGTQIDTQPGFYARQQGQWHRLLSSFDIDFDSDFTVAPNGLATRETIRQYVESVLTAIGGSFKGAWDASAGLVPNAPEIKAGDSWRISVAGNITGLPGGITQVQVGDLLIASVDNPANAGQFFVLQTNIADSSNVLVGGTFTPQTGAIAGTDSIKVALQKLAQQISEVTSANTAGDGIVFALNRFNIHLATNSGLELTATDGTGQLRIKGLADFTALDNSQMSPLGFDAFGNAVISLQGAGLNMAGQGLNYNALTDKIDLGGPFSDVIDIQSVNGSNYIVSTTDGASSAKINLQTVQISLDVNLSSIGVQTNSAYLSASDGTDFITFNASSSGLQVQSSLPEYSLPAAGGRKGVYVNEFGRLFFADDGGTKFSETITGNGTATSFTVTHNKDSKDLIVQVFDMITDDEVEVSIIRTTVNDLDIIFAVAPPNGQPYRVVVI